MVHRPKYQNELELEVRDYECDLQGVVNNANYLHYLEHARHKWMLSLGIDFDAMHKQGIDLIVVHLEIDYKFPLQSRDRFVVRSYLEREGRLRFIFHQDIYKPPDDRFVAQAKVVAAALQKGRPVAPPEITDKIDKLLV